jgi:hypothetical protein
MMMAWRLHLNLNQGSLDSIDPWRQTTFTPCALVQMPLDQNGGYQVELWPVPSIIQPLPFIAIIQPPNLVNDGDTLPAYIRCDIVVKLAIADAKVYRGPGQNKYYDSAQAASLRAEAEKELVYMALNDENLYRSSIVHGWEQMRFAPIPNRAGGWAINTGVDADSEAWW